VRQAVLIVVLVAAAFLGGAFVNGPGLQWAQTRVLRSLGLNNGGEITSVDLKPTASSEMVSDGSGSAQPEADTTHGPIAPMPALLAEDESSKYDASDRRPKSQTGPKSSSIGSGRPSSGTSSPSLATTRPVALAESPADELVPRDLSIRPSDSTLPPTPASTPSRLDSNVAPAILNSLAALLPSSSPSSGSPAPPSSPPSQLVSGPRSVANGSDTWGILERKMQSLGVSRYTMDGEPGGRVAFSCLIPLVGRQAVTQRFEAEGDDIVQAAQATLRRITLWRATEVPSQ
jgi:hypothetical protein